MSKKDNFKLFLEQFYSQQKNFTALYSSQINTSIMTALRKSMEPMQKLIDSRSNTLGTQFKDIFNASTAAFVEECFFPFVDSLASQASESINEQFLLALKPLFHILDGMEVKDNYVEIENSPVSRHFNGNDDLAVDSSDKLKWDFNKIIAFMTLIIALFTWLFPEPLSHLLGSESTDPKNTLTSEQSDIIIEYLSTISKNTEIIVQKMAHAPAASGSDLPPSKPLSDIRVHSPAKEPDREGSCTCCSTQPPSITE